MMLRDLLQSDFDGAGNAQARTLSRRSGASVAAAESDGARQLGLEEINFGLKLVGAVGVAFLPELLQFLVKINQATPIFLLRLRVQHLPGVAAQPVAKRYACRQ